jgi:hypothetical protein
LEKDAADYTAEIGFYNSLLEDDEISDTDREEYNSIVGEL